MSKVAGQSDGLAAQTPWDDRASTEVRQLRRAITSQMSQEKVPKDVAPMMAELLARLDAFVEGKPKTDLAAPRPPNMAEPPSFREAAAALSRTSGKVKQAAASVADPQQQATLGRMVQVLDRHLAMRQEVVMRSG